MKKECIDHRGHKFKSIEEMCQYWRVSPSTYSYRIKCGKSVKFALTALSHAVHKGQIAIDHKGNKFNSFREMIAYWDIEPALYYGRKSNGWTLEECLTGIKHPVYDHKGNQFGSVKEMTGYYGVCVKTYYERKRKGWTLEECLLGKAV